MIGIGQRTVTRGFVGRAALALAILLSATAATTASAQDTPAAGAKQPVGTNPFAQVIAQGPPTIKAWHSVPGVKIDWINTGGKEIKPEDLRGKFVLLDFWTYCCINCMHILPELKKLEHAYPNELVVIGVHSAKFDNERDSKNITDAVLRYEIEHPVANDNKMAIWNEFNVRSWPSLVLMDPDGKFVARSSGLCHPAPQSVAHQGRG